MAETRANYKIYLDGIEVSYSTVALANYKVVIDDNSKSIFLTPDTSVTTEVESNTYPVMYPVFINK